jgi:molecular chaperone GrpE
MKVKKKREGRQVEELKNQLARALADYDNLRKRVEKEREEIVKLAGVSLFVRLIPVFDMLDEAQNHLKDFGLEQINKELRKALMEEGIVEVKVDEGDNFDENVHEAIEVEEAKDEKKKGKIAKGKLQGWRIEDGPVIRPAKVKVFK